MDWWCINRINDLIADVATDINKGVSAPQTSPSRTSGHELAVARLFDMRPRFIQAAGLAGIVIPESDVEVEVLPAPHKPPTSLPNGKFAVYVFMYGDRCFKVGKAGPKSAARFCGQHYSPLSAPSTLAKSLIKAQVTGSGVILDADNIAAWIRNETARINFLLPSKYGPDVLSLLESFVQCFLKPEYEGFPSQRVPPNTAPTLTGICVKPKLF